MSEILRGVWEVIVQIFSNSGYAYFFTADGGWKNAVMLVVAFVFLYLGIKKGFEPLLMIPIAFGMLLANIPSANLAVHYSSIHEFIDLMAGRLTDASGAVHSPGLIDFLYFGVKAGVYPPLIFMGIGAMTEFVPLIANPNAGMPEIVNGEAVYNCPPEEFVALVPEMLKAGVALFGGCCGTTEEHIAALKAALKDAEYVRPAPECLDLLPAATEKEAFFLPADATHGAVLAADGDLEDKLSDAMDDEWPMVALKLASWADVDALADYQYMIRKPLCLICDDAELLEAGLRAYQGRALYEGNLTEDALAPLVEKYGLLV